MTDKSTPAPKSAPDTSAAGLRLFGVLVSMIAVMLIAVVFTLGSFQTSLLPIYQYDVDSSPLGYTRSLSLVYVPIALLLFWFLRYKGRTEADWIGLKHTLYFLVPLWTLVDIVAAPSFFEFPNCKATLEWYIPAWIPGAGFSGQVPIEELFFYLGASLLFLLLYVWSKTVWFPAAPPSEPLPVRARASVPVVVFNSKEWLGFAAVIGLATFYKWHFAEAPTTVLRLAECKVPVPAFHGKGFPLYLTLLIIVAVGPAALLWRKLVPLINLQAMLFSALTGLLISLMWEVTLALPYGWWNYNHHWMTGIFIKPWFGLPFEAALLWLCAGVGSVILFELFRSQFASQLGFWRFLFGPAPVVEEDAARTGAPDA